MSEQSITQSELKSQLHYNPLTGIFTWLISKSNQISIGDTAGYKNSRGYIRIKINGCKYHLMRLEIALGRVRQPGSQH